MGNSDSSNQYDCIIIGSGMGALATASVLSQMRGKRILMLERHYIMGGFTHEFKRKKWSWDVGIHYIGDVGEGSMLGTLFDIITRKGLKWNKMPHIVEKFVYPDFTFPVPSDEDEYITNLIKMFPAEEEAIKNFFDDVNKIDKWWGRHNMKSPYPHVDKIKRELKISGFDTADISIGDYMDKNFKDKKLSALLLSQWGDYGIPPSKASIITHVGIVRHYLKGGYFPAGGSHNIAKSIKPIIEEAGGEIKLSHAVEEILIEDGKAVGVRARNLVARKEMPETMEFFAPVIISNAGAHITYNKLLPESVEIPFRQQLNDFYQEHPVTTSVTAYIGLKDDPRKLGFEGENHWMFSSYDHNEAFAEACNWAFEEGDPQACYLSFPSLKNPEAKGHSAEIIALTPYGPFGKWEDSKWKNRGEEYEKLKVDITEKLIRFVDTRYPGFADMVEYKELSTPLSVQTFTDHPQGSIYGVPSVVERFRSDSAPWCTPLTPVEGLFLTGADACASGVAGALMGAMATLAQVPDGISFLKVIKEGNKLLAAQKETADV